MTPRTNCGENLLVALDTLRTRKVRSALTILGIVIGVTSVISVAAIIDGLNGFMEDRIKHLRLALHLRHPHSRRIHRGHAAAQDPHAQVPRNRRCTLP